LKIIAKKFGSNLLLVVSLYQAIKLLTFKLYIMTYTKTEIIAGINKVFTNAQFYVTATGDLTMSLEGDFVDHKWAKGTFKNN